MTRIINKAIGVGMYLFILLILALRADASIRFVDDPPRINAACITAVSGSSISATAVGANAGTGFQTRYVLTNGSGVIQSVNATGTFTAPVTAGEYRIYAVNYDGTAAQQPNLTNGTNISAIGGDCVDVSDTPKCFNVISGNVTCTEVNSGAPISATSTGNNTAAGFATRYVLTNAGGIILNSNTTGSFTAPVLSGEVRIYAVNYATAGAQPGFTVGSNISAIGGDCVDVSAVPKCFNVTICEQPTLAIEGSSSCTTTGWSFTINTSGTVQLPQGVTRSGNTVNVPSSMTEVAVYASNSCGEASETISIKRPVCPPPVLCDTPVTLSVGTPVTYCNGNNGFYSVSFSSNGIVTTNNIGTIQGNSVVNIPINTPVTLTAKLADCSDREITINSPDEFNCPLTICDAVNPGISYSLACNNNGTYSINYVTAPGVSVVSSSGSFANLTGNVTLTVTKDACNTSKQIQITAPQCVVCQQPLLSLGGDISCTTDGWSFTVNSNGNVRVPQGVTLAGNTVNVPASMAQVAVYASNSCGEASETISVNRPTCPTPAECATPITLNVGTPVTYCNGSTGSYSVSFSSNGTVTASEGDVQGNAVINIPAGKPVTLTARNAGCPDQVITVNAPAGFTCPMDVCTDKNPGISYSLACNANGTYSINYTAAQGTVVTSSANSFTNLTGNVTLTIVEAGCTIQKTIQVTAPQCVVCQQPLLSVGGDISCTTTGWSFTVNTNGTIQLPQGVTLTGNTVNVPASMATVAVHATNSCGEASETISVKSPVCPKPGSCAGSVTLTVGTPVTYCSGNTGFYSVSFSSNANVTASAGIVQGNSVIDIPMETAVTLTTHLFDCPGQVITVNAPVAFTCPVVDPCNDKNPGISYSLACNANGTYSINYTAAQGTVVTSSANSFTNLTGNVTLTIVEAGCTVAKTIAITAPVCVTCQQPLLSVGSEIACTTTGWSFTVNSNGTIQVPAGVTLTGNTVNVPSTMTQVAVYASNSCGETSETISINRPTCPVPVTCVTPITLNAGTPVTSCNGTSATYSVSFSSNGTVTASAGTVQGNAVINIPVGTAVTLTASNATCPSQIITVNSPAAFTCPTDQCNDKNPGISYSLACNANGTYSINYTAAQGTVVTSSANSFTNLTGNVTLSITEAGCTVAKTIAITAPVCVTCQQPVLSVGSEIACTTTGWSFTVNSNGSIQVPAGVTLTGNTVNVPSSMTQVAVYASNSCGETSETISINRPTCPVPVTCVTPISLNAGTPVTSCNGTSATYSVSFSSNGTVTASAGTVQGNAVINIPGGTAVTLTASNATCPSQIITVNSPAVFTCPTDPCTDKNPGISYSLACNANGTYSINYTAANGTVVTSSANSFTNLTGNVTLSITEAGCTVAKTIAITAPVCEEAGEIAVVKTGVLNNSAGTITYTFRVTNVGTVTLSNVSISDPMLGTPIVLNTTTLAPGASAVGTAVYTITPADRSNGSVTNTATVTGKTAGGTTVSDTSGGTVDDDIPTVIVVPKCPAGVKCLTVKVTKNK